jgi:hypothetical protein
MTCDACVFGLDVLGGLWPCGVALDNDGKKTDRNNNAAEKADVKRETKAGSAWTKYS